jgi:glycerophosphoryl diester phosphodiesterase
MRTVLLITAAALLAGCAGRVIPWTVNEPADIRKVLDLGVDGIISDRPDLVLQAIRREAVASRP